MTDHVTERLYYDDAYTLSFTATIIEQTTYQTRPAVILDRSYFYPESGGQQPDHGTLNHTHVIDTQIRESDQAVLHVVTDLTPDLAVGQTVTGQIDAVRRFDHMQQHTAQHILSQALWQAAQAETVSVHMTAESLTIDFNRASFTPEQQTAVEDLANRVVVANYPIRCWYPAVEVIPTLGLRKIPPVIGKLRVVDIGGFDVTACGGTHVAHTGELGMIKILKVEKQKSGSRLEFTSGWRALRDYRAKQAIISQLAVDLSVNYRELPAAIMRQQDENKQLRTAVKEAKAQLAVLEAAALVAAAPTLQTAAGPCKVVTYIPDHADQSAGTSVEDAKLLLQAVVAQGGTVALFGIAGIKTQLIFGRSADVAIDVVPLLKLALGVLGADRGGGRPELAQGGGMTASAQQVTAAVQAVTDHLQAR
jgi:alanyl-tRNA synthetase